MQNNNYHPYILEITVISAQDLKAPSFTFSNRIQPFVTVSQTTFASECGKNTKIYQSRVDNKDCLNPTWGDKFQVRLDQTFFYQRYPGIYIQIYSKNIIRGKTHLGWCVIPAADILNQFSPFGSTQFLSYRLRDKDASRGHGIVNIAVSLSMVNSNRAFGSNVSKCLIVTENNRTVIGYPVMNEQYRQIVDKEQK